MSRWLKLCSAGPQLMVSGVAHAPFSCKPVPAATCVFKYSLWFRGSTGWPSCALFQRGDLPALLLFFVVLFFL